MEPITIREATIEDLPSIREICKITCTNPYLLEHLKTLYLLYADYYLNEEQGHCFVALAHGTRKGYAADHPRGCDQRATGLTRE